MYNLLIVDDEPLILEGLYKMVVRQFQGKFIVYQADSAEKALNIFRNSRIDLLMTDICMPETDGLRMAEIVEREWPDCLTIFLTGHSEFEYARRAVRKRVVAYVLKLDGDQALCAAIEKAYERLEREYDEKSSLLHMTESWKEAVPLLKQECLRYMVLPSGWDRDAVNKLKHKMKAADVGFDLDKSFLMALICLNPETDTDISARVQSIVTENLKGAFEISMASVLKHAILLLAQAEDNRPVRLKGFLEIANSMCERLDIQAPQIYLYEEEIPLQRLGAAFSVLGWKRFELEGGGSVLLCGGRTVLSNYTWRQEGPVMGAFQVEKISDSLVYGKLADFRAALQELREKMDGDDPARDVTVYVTLASLLMQAVLNYLPREKGFLSHMEIGKIANYAEHRNFHEACCYLEGIAERYFAGREAVHSDTDHYIVAKVKAYVPQHLGEDLSVARLGEAAGLHPSYLSRIYKKVTGQSLVSYITEQRLAIARELLCDPTVRMQTIAERSGLATASYFTHFFKKHMGLTPQEYRSRVTGAGDTDHEREGNEND